jgi:transcriptional regulator with XRE-family HTH domain
MNYTEQIKQRMYERDMTPVKLAEKLKISTSKIHKTLNGTQSLKVDLLDAIASALDTTITELTDLKSYQSLTGIQPVDALIKLFFSNIFRGNEGYNRLKDCVAEDYQIMYADEKRGTQQKPNKLRFLKSFREEIQINWEQDPNNAMVKLHSASPMMGQCVMIHQTVYRDVGINGAELLPRVQSRQRRGALELIDVWALTKSFVEIEKGQSFKIQKRWLKALRDKSY